MKHTLISILLFLALGFQRKAEDLLHEKLSINQRKGTLLEVLNDISENNKIQFSYASNIIDNKRKVAIPTHMNSLKQILPHLFSKAKINYKISKRKVILYRAKSKNKKAKSFIHIEANLINKESKESIPFAAIQVKNKLIGASSNINGVFELKLSNSYLKDTLIFSCLGFENREVTIQNIINSDNKTIGLVPSSIQMEEVLVKPKPAVEMVREAIAAIPKNYPTEKFQFDAFYRSLLKRDGKYVRMSEAACRFQSAPYNQDVNKFEQQKNYSKGNWSQRNLGVYERLQSFFDLHVAEEDKVNILEARKSRDYSRRIQNKYNSGGPLNGLSVDKVKLKTDFLNPDRFRYYKYSYKGVTSYDGREVYIISFRPKRIQFRLRGKDYRKKSFRYKLKNAELSGEMYIDTKTMAFVRINTSRIMKPYKNFPSSYYKSLIDYKQINNTWYLWNTGKKYGTVLSHRGQGKDWDFYEMTSQLMLSSLDTLSEKKFIDSISKPFSEMYSLYKDENEYNPEFWQNYSGIVPSAEDRKIMGDLGKHENLERQFRMAHKYDSCMQQPLAYEMNNSDIIHGETRQLPYTWMENKHSDSVNMYLVGQNNFTDNYALQYKKIAKKHANALEKWFKNSSVSRKYKQNGYEYYERHAANDFYPNVYRKKLEKNAPEELILDVNKLSENNDSYFWEGYEISASGNKLAFYSDTTGAEQFNVQFKDLKTREFLPDVLFNAYFVGWDKNEENLYYIEVDSLFTVDKLYRHKMGTPQSSDEVIYHETNDMYDLHAGMVKNNEYILLTARGYSNNRQILLNLKTGELKILFPFKENRFTRINFYGDYLYAAIEEDSSNFIIRQDLQNFTSDTIYHSGNTYINEFDLLHNNLFITELNNNRYTLKTIDLNTGKEKLLSNEKHWAVYSLGKIDSLKNTIKYYESSIPGRSKEYVYNINKAKAILIRKSDKLKGFKESNYKLEQIEVKADDGTLVPVSIYYHKNTYSKKHRKPVPMLVTAYGCYGTSQRMFSNPEVVNLLDDGWAYAFIHTRGGREKGSKWFRDGNSENKINTYTDVANCAQELVNRGYTSSKLMCLEVASAGGVVGGYIINNHPELFSAILMNVPVTDLISSLNSIYPMDRGHQTVYGNPEKLEDYKRIMKYTPMDNVRPTKYPSVLITCGYNDNRVRYWQAAKYAALLQKNNLGSNPILLKTYLNAGHGSFKSNQETFREHGFQYGFLKYEIERKNNKTSKSIGK